VFTGEVAVVIVDTRKEEEMRRRPKKHLKAKK